MSFYLNRDVIAIIVINYIDDDRYTFSENKERIREIVRAFEHFFFDIS